jgi:hypothetical protein
MFNLVREVFASITKITGVTAIDATADTIAVHGRSVTFVCVTGKIWINPLITAVADATAFLLTAGQSIDLVVKDDLSIISDATGGTYQIIYWDL